MCVRHFFLVSLIPLSSSPSSCFFFRIPHPHSAEGKEVGRLIQFSLIHLFDSLDREEWLPEPFYPLPVASSLWSSCPPHVPLILNLLSPCQSPINFLLGKIKLQIQAKKL